MPERTTPEALRKDAEQSGEKRGPDALIRDAALTKALEDAWAEDEHAVLSEAVPKNDAGVRPPGPLFPWMPAILVFFLGLGLYRAWIELVFVTPTFLFPAANVATHDMYDIIMAATLLGCAAFYKRLNPPVRQTMVLRRHGGPRARGNRALARFGVRARVRHAAWMGGGGLRWRGHGENPHPPYLPQAGRPLPRRARGAVGGAGLRSHAPRRLALAPWASYARAGGPVGRGWAGARAPCCPSSTASPFLFSRITLHRRYPRALACGYSSVDSVSNARIPKARIRNSIEGGQP